MYSWQKKNMKSISFRYTSSFVDNFRKVCEKNNINQSQFFKECMQKLINELEDNFISVGVRNDLKK